MEKPEISAAIHITTEGSGPKHNRIGLCVDDGLHDLWKFCTDNSEGVPEAVRNYIRQLLPPIADEIRARKARAKSA
jgi:hypothetical protein